MFEQDSEKFGKPKVDLFAADLNANCEGYVSFKPDRNAFAVDVFTQNWNGIKDYVFLPFCLIERISTKIKRDETSVIVVVPCSQFLRTLEHDTVSVLLKAHFKVLQIQ